MTRTYVPPPRVGAPGRPPGLARVVAMSSIGGVAALIAVGAFVIGRSLGPDEDARVRVPVAETAAETAVEPAPRATPPSRPVAAAPEPASLEPTARPPTTLPPDTGPFADFDLALLHPDVAAAVRAARAVRAEAEDSARRAEAAARRARSGAQGTGVVTYENGDVYEGEIAGGVRHGVGVYRWANTREDHYAGEFRDDVVDGLGVKRWADGATYYGDRRQEAREGHGVFVYADGGGYEGAWSQGAPDGHGVVWNADGTVRSQGLWAGNTLVEAWIVPKPVPVEEVEGAAAEPAGGAPEEAADAGDP